MIFFDDVEYVIAFLLEMPGVDDVMLVFPIPFGVVVVPGMCLRVIIVVPVEMTKRC